MDALSGVDKPDVAFAAQAFAFKKAIEASGNTTLSLLASVAPVAQTNNPPNLGSRIDIKA